MVNQTYHESSLFRPSYVPPDGSDSACVTLGKELQCPVLVNVHGLRKNPFLDCYVAKHTSNSGGYLECDTLSLSTSVEVADAHP
jgi:hypothetical protein